MSSFCVCMEHWACFDGGAFLARRMLSVKGSNFLLIFASLTPASICSSLYLQCSLDVGTQSGLGMSCSSIVDISCESSLLLYFRFLQTVE